MPKARSLSARRHWSPHVVLVFAAFVVGSLGGFGPPAVPPFVPGPPFELLAILEDKVPVVLQDPPGFPKVKVCLVPLLAGHPSRERRPRSGSEGGKRRHGPLKRNALSQNGSALSLSLSTR